MGANAQTSVPTFTAGDVLTAANMNISARTGVPVFADTTARDAAFGGAGEKTLAEGQLCYVENLSGIAQLQFYDGTSWISFTAGGLSYLTGASFTAVASVSLPNGTFTSTYRNYKVLWVVTEVSTSLNITMRMRASGTDNTAANYSSGFIGRTNNATTFTGDNDNQTDWELGGSDTGQQGIRLSFDFIDPQQATKTFVTGTMVTSATGATGFGGAVFGSFHNTNTQFDAASLIASTGNITGYYRVYGYLDS